MSTSPERNTEKEPDIDHILQVLRATLPDIARNLIVSRTQEMLGTDSQKPYISRQENFQANPDDPAEHSPEWHQHGVLTHSEKFREFLKDDAPKLMEQWGLPAANETLLEKIDSVSKADLLQIASLLHDVGKFTSRTFEVKDGTLKVRFNDHEKHSGEIILGDLKATLQAQGLSEAQIEYIARCAAYHFELGKIRRVAIEEGTGYTMAFANSEAFKTAAQKIISENSDIALEIGLMFIADSLSKTEVAAATGTDEEIEAQRADLEQIIKDKGLDPRLINQALQQPVNMEIGKQYLRLWAEQHTGA